MSEKLANNDLQTERILNNISYRSSLAVKRIIEEELLREGCVTNDINVNVTIDSFPIFPAVMTITVE